MPPETRPRIETSVDAFEIPSADWREAATDGEVSRDRHDALLAETPALNTIRIVNGREAAPTGDLRIAAWNIERCKDVEASAQRIRDAGADIVLATEMDIGMARAGNRDTVADLADALHMNHATGVEFIELGHGDAREIKAFGDTPNEAGLHCNAVLTRFPIDRALVIPLDAGGLWYGGLPNMGQRRIGGRNAIAVRHASPVPFWVVSVHFESESTPESRLAETQTLTRQMKMAAGFAPVIIGGDFNCKGLAAAGLEGPDMLKNPGVAEPMFTHLAAQGFTWTSSNTDAPTTREMPWYTHFEPKRIDWMFLKGAMARNPAVIEALAPDGTILSDHEMIVADVSI